MPQGTRSPTTAQPTAQPVTSSPTLNIPLYDDTGMLILVFFIIFMVMIIILYRLKYKKNIDDEI
jgi:hypothetical protein